VCPWIWIILQDAHGYFLMLYKSDSPYILQSFINFALNFKQLLKVIMVDNGSEFMSIIHFFSFSWSISIIISILSRFGGEYVLAVIYLINWFPFPLFQNKSSFEELVASAITLVFIVYVTELINKSKYALFVEHPLVKGVTQLCECEKWSKHLAINYKNKANYWGRIAMRTGNFGEKIKTNFLLSIENLVKKNTIIIFYNLKN